MSRFNERFAVSPAKSNDLHQALRLKPPRLQYILCHREQRCVGVRLIFHYDRKQVILERSEVSEELAGEYVKIYDFSIDRWRYAGKGLLLPYRVFSKDQRVSHTIIVENKRLGMR